MDKNSIDILLDDTGDDKVLGGDFATGDGTEDDYSIILRLNSGELKSDPILATNLVKIMNSKKSPSEIIQGIKLALQRNNKNPKSVSIVNGYIKIDG